MRLKDSLLSTIYLKTTNICSSFVFANHCWGQSKPLTTPLTTQEREPASEHLINITNAPYYQSINNMAGNK